MGRANAGFFGSFFDVGITADAKNPDRYAVYLGQGGLGLPDRDYYLKPSSRRRRPSTRPMWHRC